MERGLRNEKERLNEREEEERKIRMRRRKEKDIIKGNQATRRRIRRVLKRGKRIVKLRRKGETGQD